MIEISKAVVSGPLYPYQAARFRSRLEALGLTQKAGARALGIAYRDMRYYCAGRKYAPMAVRDALEVLYENAFPRSYHP